ncbi:SMC5-SMC6 complex localization factor protein 1-like isoform X1 [Carassius carassius]|uniref:SMC5-SMC6 complex localization factor protein 1-like isoform X1 n=2 Tax=Carassius carassius TaxID=217509 RepID=UPI002868C38F|nr:SMC5-SMC6 complex localization factor protein 1-like isoform X1 [Carassius carassius]
MHVELKTVIFIRMFSDDIWRAVVGRARLDYNSSYGSEFTVFSFRMVGNKYIFQMSGIKNHSQKRQLLQGIRKLGGVYIGGSVYNEATTHLIVQKALASEKFLAACAGGKWIVTPGFILDSVNQKVWLPEASYELNLTAQTPETPNPLKTWRERVSNGTVSGAFQGWVALVDIDVPASRSVFVRILKAGKAVVFTDWPTSYAVTHVLTKNTSKDKGEKCRIPHYSVSYVAKHLFGHVCSELNWSCNLESFNEEESFEMDIEAAAVTDNSMDVTDDLSHKELEKMLKEYIITMEQRQKMLLTVPEFHSYYTPNLPVQIPAVDFSNVQSLVECTFFPQALEEILGSLQPGVMPPALLLQQLMHHALHGDAKPLYLSMFITVLHSILRNNPTWGSPGHTKYFLQILQCPDCKGGLWSLLETSFRVCLASKPTCHSLPSPPSTELFRLHCNLQEFFLRLFQLELHAASAGRSPGRSRASVLYSTFWNMWEKSTLTSRAVQQLSKLLIKTVLWAFNSTQEWKLGMSVTLQETLCVVVEFWAQEHSPLNSSLVEKGFKDLAEHMAILCQDLHGDVLKELIPALRSARLRMFTVDAIYRNICCSRGLILSSEPLCLLKIVSTYLKALGTLCDRGPVQTLKGQTDRLEMNQPSTSSAAHAACSEAVKDSAGGSGSGRETVPRGYHRVNAAGETLLHRACKKNQVEMLLCILSVPGTDVNIKDHAGWTPLHEACNHGSTECVQALLKHCPNLQLGSQVQGVSPLHDALLNQHTHIAKMLLQSGGLPLLKLRDSEGQTPLDLVSLEPLREELLRCAEEGDKALAAPCLEVRDLPFIETCSWVLSCLFLTYLQEQHVPTYKTPLTPLDLSPSVCRRLIRLRSDELASTWGDSRAVTLAEDLRTVLSLEQYVSQVSPALRRCHGDQTRLFMQLLDDLQAEGAALISGQSDFD